MNRSAYSREQVDRVLIQVTIPSSWRIIPARYAVQPLGTARADSRLSAATDGYTVLYCSPDFPTAFIETVVRDRFTHIGRHREIAFAEVRERAWARIESVAGVALTMLDLRGDGCTIVGAPTDAVRAKDHAVGRAFGRAIHSDRGDVDGILYGSRLTGKDVYAVYDRAIRKLEATESGELSSHPELPGVLRRYEITLF